LGIDQKFLEPKLERKLRQVSGSYTYFADGDVLLAKITPCFENGKLGIARNLTNGIGFGSSEYIVFRPNANLSSEYLYYFFLQDSFRAEGTKTMSGAVGHKRVSKEFIERCQIPVPPLPEQQRVVAILDDVFAGLATATANAEKNLNNARDLFDSYLDSVFTQRAEEWTVCPLADCLERITYGFTNPMPTTVVGPYMITAKNVIGGQIDYASARRTSRDAFDKLLTDKSRPKIGDVLLTKDGTLGRLAVVDRADVCINQSVALLRLNRRIEPHFLKRLLSSRGHQNRMMDDAGGTTIKHIYITRVDKMDVAFPNSEEQRRIVVSLDERERESARLESLYQTKLDSLSELK
jgi:type I restriction enzyme S subunit